PGESMRLFLSGDRYFADIFRENEGEAKRILSFEGWENKKDDDVSAFLETELEGRSLWLGVKKA
ncbi:MAG: hypothetical protein PHP35_01990, partial [Candidatus Colwellbacteria bacterium]|nr:hypothetical protein [Candidatus Colwellbacteria bacterium]